MNSVMVMLGQAAQNKATTSIENFALLITTMVLSYIFAMKFVDYISYLH